MGVDFATVKPMIEQGLPYVKKLGVVLVEGGPNRVRLALPYEGTNLNHVGSVHAGAIFTFAETAGGAAILFSFDLSKVRLLAKSASIEYKRLVNGDLTADVEIPQSEVDRVMSEVETAGKTTYNLPIVLKDTTGEVAANISILYHFKKM